MDETTSAILRAFPAEYVDSDGERFFDTLIDHCRDGTAPSTVDGMIQVIGKGDATFGSIARRYADNLRATGLASAWADATAAMVREGSGARLVAVCRRATTAPFTWAEFVSAQRDFWSTWRGTDWPAWREAFRRTGEQYGLGADADAQLDRLEHLSIPDRATYLQRTLGFTVHPSAFGNPG